MLDAAYSTRFLSKVSPTIVRTTVTARALTDVDAVSDIDLWPIPDRCGKVVLQYVLLVYCEVPKSNRGWSGCSVLIRFRQSRRLEMGEGVLT